MTCRAPFPSFTTVILSACDSFKYSNHHNPPQRENGVLQYQTRFRRELDFMKTIDFRDGDYCDSAFSTPNNIIEDEESSDEDEYLNEKMIWHGPSGVISKPKLLIPRFWSKLVRLSFRHTRKVEANEVVLNLNN